MPEREAEFWRLQEPARSLRVPARGLSSFAIGAWFSGCGHQAAVAIAPESLLEMQILGNSWEVQWLGLQCSHWVCSLVGELKSTNHVVQAKKKKKKQILGPYPRPTRSDSRVRAQPSRF